MTTEFTPMASTMGRAIYGFSAATLTEVRGFLRLLHGCGGHSPPLPLLVQMGKNA
jgi:hypothetical protein